MKREGLDPWQGANFLEKWLDQHKIERETPWILAISGGVDSMGLLVAFIELWQKKSTRLPLLLVVAHLDHGWRKESADQASQLKAFVEAHGLVFVSRRLEEGHGSPSMNLEASARFSRYQFFEEVAKEYQTSILFLAHQAADRRETLLKNLLEGKELAFLHGIKKKSTLGTLTLLRPWLEVEKESIQQALIRSQQTWFEDETNRDLRFLRSRMREKLFPVLDAHWPKAWRKGLDQVADYSEELFKTLDQRFSIESTRPIPVIGGWLWELPHLEKAYEWRYYLRLASSSIEPLNRSGAKQLVEAIMMSARMNFRSKRYLWQLHDRYLVAQDLEACLRWGDDWNELFKSPQEGKITRWGPWEVACVEKQKVASRSLTLKDYWKGSFLTPYLPEASWTHLDLIEESSLRSKVLRHMQRRHIPTSIRCWMPLMNDHVENFLWSRSSDNQSPFVLVWSWVASSRP